MYHCHCLLCVSLDSEEDKSDSPFLSTGLGQEEKQVDILISKNQALRILYPSSIIPCMIIINFIVYNDTVLQCYTQTYLI